MKNSFIKSILTLVNGTAVSQFIVVMAMPMLTRLYTPSDFGMLAIVITIAGFITTFSTLSYESAIVLEEDVNVSSLVALCFLILIILSLAAGVFTLPYFGIENWHLSIYIMLMVLFLSSTNILFAFINRQGAYQKISKSQIVRALVIITSQLLIGYFIVTEYGLIIGNIFGSFIALIVLFLTLKDANLHQIVNILSLKRMMKKHKDFPRFTAPQNLIGFLLDNFPIFVIGLLYDASTLGFYFLSKKIVQIPGGVLGSAVKRVFYREASILTKNENILDLKKLYVKMVSYMALLIVIPILVVFVYAPEIFSLILGKEWLSSGYYAKWMILSFGALFVMAPTRVLFLVFKRQKQLLTLDLFIGSASVIGFLMANLYYDLITAVAVFSIISAIGYIIIVIGWFFYFQKHTHHLTIN
jgi:lipopolysaccharide exporter